MTLAQRQLVAILVICVITTPIIQAAIFSPGQPKSIKPSDSPKKVSGPTKVQVFKAYAKGYAKAGVVMAVMLTVFKAAQIDKLFELIFGKDTSVQDLQEEILDKFDEIEQLITTSTHSTIEAVSGNLMLQKKLVTDFQLIDDFLHFLKHQTDRMSNYINTPPTNATLRDFADSIVQHGNSSVLDQMKKVRQMLTIKSEQETVKENFMDLYAQYLQRTPSNRLCHLTTSPQQTMFNLLRKLIYAEAAAMTLISYAYSVKTDLSGGAKQFEAEKNNTEKEFEDYSLMIQILMQHYLPRLERNYWKCDASIWLREGTFLEFNRWMYGMVEFESDLSLGHCKTACYELQQPRQMNLVKRMSNRSCNGYIGQCGASSKGTFEYCYSNNEFASEMYSYVSSDVMRKGSKELCQGEEVKSVSTYLSGVFHCEYCACICHSEDKTAHRFLSLLPQLSNIDENQVIVGVRFVKRNRVLYLQIMQAPLLPYAAVDMDSAEWRDIDELGMLPPEHTNLSGYHAFDHKNREMYMKELEVPGGSLLTGVKFIIKDGVPDLSIRYTFVDWETGELNQSSSLWMTEKHDTYDTNDMLYQNQLPDQCKTPSFIDTASGQRFRFGTSALDQDGAQHVLPYFDAQPVVPMMMVPLSGVGITHKGDDRCGGFISPVVFTVNEEYLFGDDSEGDPF